MFNEFIVNAEHKQVCCITDKKKILTISIRDFTKYIPFQWSGNSSSLSSGNLQELILEVLNDLYAKESTKVLFKVKKYNIHYIYKSENKIISYDNWMDAVRQFFKMKKNPELYSLIITDFNTDLFNV